MHEDTRNKRIKRHEIVDHWESMGVAAGIGFVIIFIIGCLCDIFLIPVVLYSYAYYFKICFIISLVPFAILFIISCIILNIRGEYCPLCGKRGKPKKIKEEEIKEEAFWGTFSAGTLITVRKTLSCAHCGKTWEEEEQHEK